jgi:hypothetical protein
MSSGGSNHSRQFSFQSFHCPSILTDKNIIAIISESAHMYVDRLTLSYESSGCLQFSNIPTNVSLRRAGIWYDTRIHTVRYPTYMMLQLQAHEVSAGSELVASFWVSGLVGVALPCVVVGVAADSLLFASIVIIFLSLSDF